MTSWDFDWNSVGGTKGSIDRELVQSADIYDWIKVPTPWWLRPWYRLRWLLLDRWR